MSAARTIEQELDSLEAEALKGGEFVGITNDLALRLIGAIRTRDAVAAAFDVEEEVLRSALGDALMYVRLALVAAALIADGFSDDDTEVRRILSSLCERLVAAGAVDPMEADLESAASLEPPE